MSEFSIDVSSALGKGVKAGRPPMGLVHMGGTDLVHSHYGAGEDAGKYRVRLYNAEDTIKIVRVYNKFYHGPHRQLTTPWIHGLGLLARTGHAKWKGEFRSAKREHVDRVGEAKEDFPNILERARARLKDLEGEVCWPTAEDWASQFTFEEITEEITSTNNLRNVLTEPEVRSIEARLWKQFRDGQVGVFQNLAEVLRDSAKAQAEYKNKKNAKLTEATARGRLQDIMDALDGLVIPLDGKRDEEMDEISKEIAGLISSCTFDELKKDQDIRNASATQANKIAEKVEAKARDLEEALEGYV